MLTACSSENDVLQSATQPQTTVQQQAVGFDIYTPAATNARRAGRVNVMTNGTMQQTGFGVYAYQTDNVGYTAGALEPNYMWNQQINFNSTASGWYYAPLKYWPNETKKDSQTTPTKPAGMPDQDTNTSIDKLTFFAYAPWVNADPSTGVTSRINTNIEAETEGLTRISPNNGIMPGYSGSKSDPIILYERAIDPNNSVDLLWGVAPAGGLSYTDVSGTTQTVGEGLPLIDMVKPAVNTNMKFLFQHALARLGVKVVAAVDQVAAGGVFDYANSKITIEKIEIKGEFGNSGWLNLNNKSVGSNIANWIISHKADGSTGNPVLTIEAGKGLAPHLVYDAAKNGGSEGYKQQVVTGVTTTLADAIKVSSTLSETNGTYVKKVTAPAYSPTTPYFAAIGDNNSDNYAKYEANNTGTAGYCTVVNTSTGEVTPNDSIYFHKHTTKNAYTNNEAYTVILTPSSVTSNAINTLSLTYPKATVWENIYALHKNDLVFVDGTTVTKESVKTKTAYREIRDNTSTPKYLSYVPTGQAPEVGDYVLADGKDFKQCVLKPTTKDYYTALPNYFMVIPTNNVTGYASDAKYRTLKVKITYYVSTIDKNLANGIVYTKNVVEKDVVLPHLQNGSAYNLKLTLGLTSVKMEADVADWTTTDAEINLPQNTAE